MFQETTLPYGAAATAWGFRLLETLWWEISQLTTFIAHRLDSTSRCCSRTNNITNTQNLPALSPRALSAACLFHGFLVKRLVLCPHVSQQQQSLPPADARVADGAACANTKAHISKAELSEVCRMRNAHTQGDFSQACTLSDSSRRVFHSVSLCCGFSRRKLFSLHKEHFPAVFSCFAAFRAWFKHALTSDKTLFSLLVCGFGIESMFGLGSW